VFGRSLLHHFCFLGSREIANLGLILFGQLLHLLLGRVAVVLGQSAVGLLGVGRLVAIAADVADRDLRLLGEIFDPL